VIGFRETVSLFHALAGLCVGWLWGVRQGVLRGIGALLGGCIVGFIVGYLMAHMPQEVHAATTSISRRHRLLGTLLAISGYLVWVGLGVAFWWFCVSFLGR